MVQACNAHIHMALCHMLQLRALYSCTGLGCPQCEVFALTTSRLAEAFAAFATSLDALPA